MAGKPWSGWICGTCKLRLEPDEVLDTVPPSGTKLHELTYLADYCGDQERYENAYCGPVRFYPDERGKKAWS